MSTAIEFHLPEVSAENILFVTELTREYSPEEAASFTVGVLRIQCKPELALKVLRGWGIYSNLLALDGGRLHPTFERASPLDFGFLKRLSEAMENDAKVRTFVVDELGAELVADMNQRGVGDLPIALANGLIQHESDPRRIGDPVGSMVETYCAKLLKTPTETNSLPDLARKLEDQGVILTPHRLLLNGVAGLRHPASHGIDKKTNEKWDITSRGSLVGQLLALVTLRSMFVWTKAGRQEV